VAVFGLGWRFASAVVAVILVAHALAVLRGPRLFSPDLSDDDDDGESTAPGFSARRATLADALRQPALLLWLLGATVCSLLDETFVVLAASWLRDELGAGASPTAIALGVWAAGSATGAFATDRLLRSFSPNTVIAMGATVCVVACCAWLAAPSVPLAAVGLFVVGFSSAPMWPIATARAYATCPGRPALVGAADTIFVPVELAMMAAAGASADLWGTGVALVLLTAQPLILLGLALGLRRRE
jgi:fucose permease